MCSSIWLIVISPALALFNNNICWWIGCSFIQSACVDLIRWAQQHTALRQKRSLGVRRAGRNVSGYLRALWSPHFEGDRKKNLQVSQWDWDVLGGWQLCEVSSRCSSRVDAGRNFSSEKEELCILQCCISWNYWNYFVCFFKAPPLPCSSSILLLSPSHVNDRLILIALWHVTDKIFTFWIHRKLHRVLICFIFVFYFCLLALTFDRFHQEIAMSPARLRLCHAPASGPRSFLLHTHSA